MNAFVPQQNTATSRKASWTKIICTVIALSATSVQVNASDSSASVGSGRHRSTGVLLADTTGNTIPNTERTGVTDKTIVIGSCLPMSGPLEPRGMTMSSAAQAYFSYINEHGGINGREIKLATCDDQFDPEVAITCFNSCLKDKAFAGAFFIGSSVITKYVRMCDVNKLPMIGFNVGVPTLCEPHPTLFNLRPCYGEEIDKQVRELWKHNLKRIAILYQSDALGAGVRRSSIAALKKVGGEAVAEASFAKGADQIDDAYNRIKQSRPDAVITAGSTIPLRALIKRRHAQGWNVPFVINSALDDPVLENGQAADGIIMTQILPPLDSQNHAVDFYKQTLKKYAPTAHPHVHGFEAFLNAMVLVEGLKLAERDLTRSKLVDGLQSLHNFDIGLGPNYLVSFSPEKHIAWGDSVISFSIVRGGKLNAMTEGDWNRH